ncbi:MAG TPA: hypothetical protein VGR93_13695, partial [Candidatus Acidoferrales bacterium]|nr:hypothetical protein [Candidatus Acidoferrales bacterium]
MAEPTATVTPAAIAPAPASELVKGLGLFDSSMERPYRPIAYPVLPAIYIVMAVFLEIQLLRYKPQNTWPGLIIV